MSSLNCQPKTTSPSASIVVSESSDNSEPSPPSNPNADSSTRQARLGTWRSRTGFTPAHAAEAKLFMQVQPYVIWEPSEEPKTSEDLKTPTNPEHSEDLKMPANFPVTLETPADPETSGAPEASGDPETSEGPETTIETLGEVWEALGHRMMRLALSDVTEAKLQTMGIVAYPTVTFSIDDILTASFDALTAAEVEPEGIAKLYEDAEDAAQGLLRKYIWLADTVKGENEPRARMFINSAIEAATPLCNGIKFKGGTGKLLMTLEYQTPRVVDTIPATTEDPTSECIGLLGGLTDYTTFFFREWSDTLEHDQEEIQRLIPNIKSMSSDELARLKLISQVQNACVTAYEAKRFEASDNALLRGIPQATAEALVLGYRLPQILDSGNERLRIVPTILSDGSRWLFTLWQPDFDVGSLGRWQRFQSEILKIEHNAKRLKSEQYHDTAIRYLRRLILVLVFWNTAERGHIIRSIIQVLEQKGEQH